MFISLFFLYGCVVSIYVDGPGATNTMYVKLIDTPVVNGFYYRHITRWAAKQNFTVLFSPTNTDSMRNDVPHLLSLATSGPDLMVYFAGAAVNDFVSKGQLLDLTQHWNKLGFSQKFTPALQKLCTLNGKQYCIPIQYYHWGIYYKPSLWAKMGLKVPNNWSQFLEICKTFKQKGITPIGIGMQYMWLPMGWLDYLNMRVNGPEYHLQLMAGNRSWTSPETRRMFELWKRDLIDPGYFYYDPNYDYGWQDMRDMLYNGSVGMMQMGDFMRADRPYDDLDFFQFPIIDSSVPVGEDAPAEAFIIPKMASNPSAALKMVNEFTDPPYQRELTLEMLFLPANPAAKDVIKDPINLKGLKMLNNADVVCQFFNRDNPNQDFVDMSYYLQPQIINGPMTHEQILQRFEEIRLEVYLGIVANPVISPSSWNKNTEVTVNMSCPTDGADIYYTIDRTTPTLGSPVYKGPFIISAKGTHVVQAFSYKSGMKPSTTVMVTYYIPQSTSDNSGFSLLILIVVIIILVALFIAFVLIQVYRKLNARRRVLSNVPKGKTLSIVFTDIQSSTALWSKYPDSMRLALSAHNRILRAAIAQNKGYEIKTVGDSFMVAFPAPDLAINFCISVQKDLLFVDWPAQLLSDPNCNSVSENNNYIWNGIRVRMGVHCGEADLEYDSRTGKVDYFGPSVNLAARIESLAYGGQVLVSERVYHLCPESNISLLSQFTLKGVEGQQSIYQLAVISGRTFPMQANVEKISSDDKPTCGRCMRPCKFCISQHGNVHLGARVSVVSSSVSRSTKL